MFETVKKNKELIPLIVFTGAAVSLASSYVMFKSLFDNQVVFDRRHPYQYKDKEAIQKMVFGRKEETQQDNANTPSKLDKKQ